MVQQIRCHRCKQWLGESSQPLEIAGMFRDSYDCERIAAPRYTWRCKACSWVNVFYPTGPAPSWREVEAKGA